MPDTDTHPSTLAAGHGLTSFHSLSQPSSQSLETARSPPRIVPSSLQPPSQPINPMWDYFVSDVMGSEPVIATGQVVPPAAAPGPLPPISPLVPMIHGSSSAEVAIPQQALSVASARSGLAAGHEQQLRSGAPSGMVPSGYAFIHYGPSFHPGR